MKSIITFIVGLLFALGLGIGGMTKIQSVKGFLDIFGDWSPSLIGVMVGGIVVHAISYRLIRRRNSPLLDTTFHVPTRKDIDKRLILGASLFGLGWGWTGICPGQELLPLQVEI